VLVQLVAQMIGIACGLLSRRPLVAMAATIVIPMTVTAALTVLAPGGAAVRWLTPYGDAQSLLTDTPTGTTYAALGVVVLLWCLIPNAVLLARLRRRSP
jgi:hypothetical protein